MTKASLKRANEISNQLDGIERDKKSLEIIFSSNGSALYNGSYSKYVYLSGLSSETFAAIKALVETDLLRKSNALEKELGAL